MSDLVLHLAILVLIAVFVFVFLLAARRFYGEYRRPYVHVAHPIVVSDSLMQIDVSASEDAEHVHAAARVRILAFSNEDDRQCRILQAPVLRRVVEAKGDVVSVINIDASNSPELTQRYHVLTVPTTVLLDARGKTYAVNYGFTNAQSLLKQVDEILSLDGAQEALS
jgi:thioredoxin-related protein